MVKKAQKNFYVVWNDPFVRNLLERTKEPIVVWIRFTTNLDNSVALESSLLQPLLFSPFTFSNEISRKCQSYDFAPSVGPWM